MATNNDKPDKDAKPKKDAKPETNAYVQELLREQAKLQADKQAVVEEFTELIKEKGTLFSDEDLRAKIKEVLPDAFAALKQLLNNAESESVKANLVRFVFDSGFTLLKEQEKDKTKDGGVPSTVKDLVEELKNND